MVETPEYGTVRADTRLRFADRWGGLLARFNIGRMAYQVAPGLYAVNAPQKDAPVLVSANYKLSFDALRSVLKKTPAWILVLDTRGINVWCAAGKGTFGTDEIVARINAENLADKVSHRRLIVPQLGAPGVAAHKVREASGFTVVYGPVRAKDIPKFLKNQETATAGMRRIPFGILDRAVLIPVEVIGHLKVVFWALLYFMALSSVYRFQFSLNAALAGGIIAALFLFAGLIAGTVVTPLLLPFIPGRAFAWKGGLAGAATYAGLWGVLPVMRGWVVWDHLAWGLMTVALSSFCAMNFTGSATYTSLSGVLKEMKIALPIQIAAFLAGAAVWTVGQLT